MTGVETRMDDAFGNASMRGPSLAVEPSSTRAGQSTAFQKNVQELLGGKIQIGGVLSGGIDLREGYPHATTGGSHARTARAILNGTYSFLVW